MHILASDFSKKTIYMYLKLEICVVCMEFFAFKYVFFLKNKSDKYLYLYIKNLKNLCLKPVFWFTIFICICVVR